MRSQRLTFVFLAFYLIFLGGSAYYTLVFPIRVFHHLLMTLLMGVWYFRKFRRDGLPHTPLNLPLLALIIAWSLSALLGIEPRNAIEGLWFMLLHITIFFVLVDLFQRGRGRLVMETQFLMGGIIILFSGIEIASWYLGLGILPNTQIGWINVSLIPLEPIRLALAMNISTLLAGYIAPLILLTIGWALTARRRDYRRVLWGMAGLLIIILILTFSRGGLVSVGVGLGAFLVMRVLGNPQRANIGKWAIPLVIMGAIGFVAVFLISQTRSSGDEIRVDMYRSATDIWRDNFFIGVGIGNYGRAFRDYRTPEMARDRLASAHNLYLNTASETGILGVMAGIWVAGALIMTWWGVWKKQATPPRKIRQEAVIAALLGVGVHSLVDVFTTTPLVSLIVLLIAYSITGHETVLSLRPQGKKVPALVACVVAVGYGIFFIQTDRAYAAHLASSRGGDDALPNAQLAQSLDPELTLYGLQVAYLTDTIPAYKLMLQTEPTWDVGWMNLAYLYEQAGQYDKALEALWIAQSINPLTEVNFNIGRMGETYSILTDNNIIGHYAFAIYLQTVEGRLPISDFWSQTDIRQQSVRGYLTRPEVTLDMRYRVISAQFPEELASLIPQNPQTASDWWVVGEYALAIENNLPKAREAFGTAIAIAPTNGDYYASRARVDVVLGADTTYDLNIATLLGVQYESLARIRANIARRAGDEETAQALIKETTRRRVGGDFAGVLYQGRFGAYDLPMAMLPPQ